MTDLRRAENREGKVGTAKYAEYAKEGTELQKSDQWQKDEWQKNEQKTRINTNWEQGFYRRKRPVLRSLRRVEDNEETVEPRNTENTRKNEPD